MLRITATIFNEKDAVVSIATSNVTAVAPLESKHGAPSPEALTSQLSLTDALRTVEAKIRDDVIRFRTCCADPRASK